MAIKKRLILTAVAALILGAGSGFGVSKLGGDSESRNQENSPEGGIVKNVGGIGIVAENDANDYTVEQIPVGESTGPTIDLPDLDRPLVFPNNFPAEARASIEEKVRTISDSLQEKPDQYESWLTLAYYRKQIDDYAGAGEIWNFLVRAYSDQSVPHANLGDLYHYYIKDFPKSEWNYLQAINIDPDRIEYYRDLYELYTYSYKIGTSAAPDILKKGLKNNPQNVDLLVLLAKHYAVADDTREAKKYYDQAITAAEKAQNPELVALLRAEMESLSR